MQPNTETKTFYSAAAGLVININIGRRVMEGSTTKVVDQKVAEFTPMPDNFGRLVTSDPEVIAKLEARMAGGDTGIFDAVEYQRRTTPADIRLKMLQDEHARLVSDHNRLLAQIEQGKIPGQPKAQKT